MDVKGTYLFNAPRDEVWEAVLDPDVLSNWKVSERISTGRS